VTADRRAEWEQIFEECWLVSLPWTDDDQGWRKISEKSPRPYLLDESDFAGPLPERDQPVRQQEGYRRRYPVQRRKHQDARLTYDSTKPNNYGTNLENYGVAPDVFVRNTPEDELKGFDRELKTAVDEALKMLKEGKWQYER